MASVASASSVASVGQSLTPQRQNVVLKNFQRPKLGMSGATDQLDAFWVEITLTELLAVGEESGRS